MIDTNNPLAIIGVKGPQFSEDPRLPDLVSLAELETSSCFGKKYSLAVALRVLHGLALEARNFGATDGSNSGSAISGSVSSLSEGGLSLGYSSPSGEKSNSGLEQTTFGQELLSLRRGNMMNIQSSNCGCVHG